MPELPDVTVYLEALQPRIVGRILRGVEIRSPFVLRTFNPSIEAAAGQKVTQLRRLGKRIAIGLERDDWLVIHLMIAGRLHWKPAAAAVPARVGILAFRFDEGTLLLTEAGTKKRASLHFTHGRSGLDALNPHGLEVLDCSLAEFTSVLTSRNHTLKRALTDPHLFSGIGNAYSDEILHRGRLSPVALTQKLNEQQIAQLFEATREVLQEWIARLRQQAGPRFPQKVTAFHPEMAVHGRHGQPCPDCGTTVQRIRFAENETNYCPRCQTGGKLLADRSLSRLLKQDWPRTIEELESR
jgi:formamidopyrimidine-DNA glycosylase